MFASGSSPAHAAIALQPADVAVVVGAEQVDAQVEAALPLVEVVGGVGGEVGRLAVALDEDPVLVVAEVGRAQPDRAVLLEDVALLAQPGQPPLDRAGLVQRALGEPDVEVGRKSSTCRCSAQLQLVARLAEHHQLLVVGQLEDRRGRSTTTCSARSAM